MSSAATDRASPLFFDREALRKIGKSMRTAYRSARPFPHFVLDSFLGEVKARALAEKFPKPDDPGWLRRDYAEQSARLGQLQRTGFVDVDPFVRSFLNELSQMAFIDFLEESTGIEGIIADPHFRGAGPSITLAGGHLALHADFNRDRFRHLERCLTAIYYLGSDWDTAWGGELELHGRDASSDRVRYAPILDRLVVFEHGDDHWHGHPTPLACPPERHRASVSCYFYKAASSEEHEAHGAIWKDKARS